jgi:mono/diheme cytochrome c family protein
MSWKKIVAGALGSVVLLVAGLVAYAAFTGEGRLAFPDLPAPDLKASSDPDVIERGRYLVRGPAHCAQCHSTPDRSRPELTATAPLSGGMEFAMGPLGTLHARNLTPDEETGIGRYSDEMLARTLRTGVMPDGQLSFFMRLSASRLSDEDIVAVISYLRAQEPVRNPVPRGRWGLVGKLLLTYKLDITPHPPEPIPHPPASEEPSVERGEYLAEYVMLCNLCHTQFDVMSLKHVGPRGGGSLPDPSHGDDKDMEFVAPNLTTHPTGLLSKMDEDAFVARMRAGRGYPSSIMPWEGFQATSEADLRSVYRYLSTLPPVDNDHGPTYRKKGWKPGT